MKKYLVYGGTVFGNNGQVHNISPNRVAQLYKVNPAECIFYHEPSITLYGYDEKTIDSLVKLRPQQNGDYVLRDNTEPQQVRSKGGSLSKSRKEVTK